MHSISQWFINEIIPAFGRTLLHSLWQGVVAAILAGAVIISTRKSAAIKRYNGLLTVYVLFLLSVAITFFNETSSADTTISNTTSGVAAEPSAIVIIGNITTTETAQQSFGASILTIVNKNATLLVGVWALLFAAQLIRMVFGLRNVQGLRKSGNHLTTDWNEWIKRMSQQLGIRQTVLLLQSEKVKVPVALGILKPIILVPIGLLNSLSAEQVEAILMHELAHIRRNDYFVNLLQSFADAVFFFNPALRWISARIREERETCCDDIAVQQTANKKGYVEALVSFSQLSLAPSLAMGIGGNKTHLLNRVKTIITRENTKLTAREQTTLLIGIMIMIAVGAFAFKPKEKEKNSESKTEQKGLKEEKQSAIIAQSHTLAKQIKSSVSNHVADTIPTNKNVPIRWKSVNTNISDDGEGKTMQVIATSEDGTTYKIRKIDNEIVMLSVNGTEIAKENYPQYNAIVEAIEQSRKQKHVEMLRAQEQRASDLLHQQQMLAEKQQYLEEHLLKLDAQREAMHVDSLHQLKLLNAYAQKEKEYLKNEKRLFRTKPDMYDKAQEYDQKMQLYKEHRKLLKEHKLALHTNPNLSGIIADILANQLAENETMLSFTLNASELIVNGKTIDKSLFEVFKKKYIKSSGDSYIYERNGNTTKSTINIQ